MGLSLKHLPLAYLAYVKAFGDDPLTVWNCMRLGEDPNMLNSEEYISKKAEGDLNTFGCKYYSPAGKLSRYNCHRTSLSTATS